MNKISRRRQANESTLHQICDEQEEDAEDAQHECGGEEVGDHAEWTIGWRKGSAKY